MTKNISKIPPKTKILYTDINEELKFKEQRKFGSWKIKGHYYFDKLWNEHKLFTRNEAYNWLGERLNISSDNAHFSKMTNEQCNKAIEIIQQLLNDLRRLDLDYGVEPKTPYYV